MMTPFTYFILLLIHLLWTVWLTFAPGHAFPLNYLYNVVSILFWLLPLIAGLRYARSYPALRPTLLLWNLSFLTAIIGQIIWSYYNFTTQVSAPFPGIGDFFWLLYYPLQLVLLSRLAKAQGFRWSFSYATSFSILLIVFAFFTTSFLFTNLGTSIPLLTRILSLAYPLFDSLLAAVALTLLHHGQSNPLRFRNLLAAAYVVTLFADVMFAYSSSSQTYWNGNGVDFIYTLAHFLLALSLYYYPLGTKPILSA